MMPKYLRSSLVVLFFLLQIITCYGNKAVKSIINFKQPNGTVIKITLHGDESFAYRKDLSGTILEQRGGYLYPSPTLTESAAIKLWQTNREKRAYQQELTKSGSISSYFPLPPCSNGIVTIKVPVILVEFLDVKFTVNNIVEAVTNQLNSPNYSENGATGSAADYFNTNFHNRYSFEFDVCPVVITLPKTQAYYGADSEKAIDINLREMLESVCKLASQNSFALESYDWLNNSQIENVNIIYAGYPQSESGNTDEIWPQYYPTNNLYYNGKAIKSFSLSSELTTVEQMAGELQGIGTFCHEFAHTFSLPDMYDINGELEGESNALCKSLSIMDEGNYLNNGRTPPLFTAIELELIGIEPINIEADKEYLLKTTREYGNTLKLESVNSGEYFLIEYREQSGWDRYIGNSGVIVYHVDKSESIYGGIASYKRWEYNNINCFSSHPCAKVLSYNNQTRVENCFFPGANSVKELNSTSNPALLDWGSRPLEINISDITKGNSQAKITTVIGESYNNSYPIASNITYTPYQYDCKLEWELLSTKIKPSTTPKWRVRWETKNSNDTYICGELTTEEEFCYISELLPNREYNAYISYQENGEYGDEVIQKIKTLEISSDLPYIPIKGEYKIDEIIDLRVLNLNEPTESIKWYSNKKYIGNNYISFSTAGEREIEVRLLYPDNSTEIITKIVNIK